MGNCLSKAKVSDDDHDDLRDSTNSKNSSCNLTDYWNKKRRDFHDNYTEGNSGPRTSAAMATDFDVSTMLDRGSYGSVMLSSHNPTGTTYATKVIAKKKIVNEKLVERVFNEKRILESINFPFVIRLQYFYQDSGFIYFVMPFASGGNFYNYIQRHGPMDEDMARFYMAEIFLAVEYLHRLNLVHRDIKSENILFDVYGHAQLADFGFCKHIKDRTYTFCGTPEYMAPEIILKQGYGKTVDYWAFGVLLYELVAGRMPFTDGELERLFRRISKGKYMCPPGFSGDLMNLLRNLLKTDVTKRYGNLANGFQDIKKHRWFRTTEWSWCAIFNKDAVPPYVPIVRDTRDTSNFDVPNKNYFLSNSNHQYGNQFEDF